MRALFPGWLHRRFVPEVRRYLASKRQPFKVLLIVDSAPGPPEPQEFNIESIRVVFLPSNTVCPLQPRVRGVTRTSEARYAQDSMGRIVSAAEENLDRENTLKVGKDPTTEDAVVVIGKAVKAIKPETVNSCWRKLSRCCARLLRT